MNRSLLLLVLCQGLFLTHNVVFIAVNGLVGLQLAPSAWMATLPLAAHDVRAQLLQRPPDQALRQVAGDEAAWVTAR